MYNRYIPQADGSYRRNRMPEPPRPVRPAPQKQPSAPCEQPKPSPPPKRKDECPDSGSVTGFLRQLLPKNFDTADLIIVLLLLLMAGNCEEDQNTALLTLALYFFM